VVKEEDDSPVYVENSSKKRPQHRYEKKFVLVRGVFGQVGRGVTVIREGVFQLASTSRAAKCRRTHDRDAGSFRSKKNEAHGMNCAPADG